MEVFHPHGNLATISEHFNVTELSVVKKVQHRMGEQLLLEREREREKGRKLGVKRGETCLLEGGQPDVRGGLCYQG